jgi:hypothetical protein
MKESILPQNRTLENAFVLKEGGGTITILMTYEDYLEPSKNVSEE